ncbi:DUF817 domain-containing protein [Seohaeicola nanhaiensis]|uniref:DUF817 domain-containing protein n=1 Tax=Seohaeicola nanhaiensis TaxID=1387282 RepID=A0ABV9KCF5_9RHOB
MTPHPSNTRSLERALGDWARGWLPFWLVEFVMFGLKQAWACLFGVLLLAGILATKAVWQPDWPVARYDALVVWAVGLQVVFLALKLETWREARVILLFHLTGTAMEIFKVSAGSWAYPEAGVLKIFGIPMFSGFMYAAVGSYMARVIRIFDMRFAPYPPFWTTLLLAVGIYVNFFAHHFLPDIRLGLFAATVLLFGRTRIWFTIGARTYWMPMVLAAFLSSLFLWIAENVGTGTGTWVYAGNAGQHWASLAKMGSWYLLLYVSFVTVTLEYRDVLLRRPIASSRPSRRSPAPAEG